MNSEIVVTISLAEQINAAHERCEHEARNALAAAIAAGKLLIDAREKIAHGKWLPWMRGNLKFSERTAQGYMRVARRAGKLESNTQRVADLPLREALRVLAEPRQQAVSIASDLRLTRADLIPATGSWTFIQHPTKGHYGCIVPSVNTGYYFVGLLVSDSDFGWCNLAGNKRALLPRAVEYLVCHEIGNDFQCEPRSSDDEIFPVLFRSEGVKLPWEFNRTLYSSHQEYIDRAILHKGAA
jgi:hypothetical protein